MAADDGGRVHIVWPTRVKDAGGEPTMALFYASSRDGRSFTARERIPTEGMPHHPQIAVAADGWLSIAWDELRHGTRRVFEARVTLDATGRPRFDRQLLSGNEPTVYPVVVATSNSTVVAWTSGRSAESVIRVVRRDVVGPSR